MICPSKNCQKEIPDDSFFCDQCGIRLLKCSVCGKLAARGNFCGKCGGKMTALGTSSDKPEREDE
ncbi:MAG: zinc ribbon domain-containing protein [Treponema sp.]|nr:zinc ribbon domain-containing protein [Treponema sp.]